MSPRLPRLWLLAGLLAGPALADEPLTRVADLRYGVGLYHYYQRDYFDALSELMVAGSRGGIQGHGDNPALIDAGIGLAFGMERRAEQAFGRLLDASRPPSVRDTAWFYLGKLQYQQGRWQQARASLARIEARADPALAAPLAELELQMLLRAGQLAEAGRFFDQLPPAQASELLRYNLGVAHGQQGEADAGLAWLAGVGQAPLSERPAPQKQQRALRDRARTAAGYLHIQRQRFAQAVAEFEQVRLTGPYSDRALLGLGWAHAQQGQYAQALAPWQRLASGPLQQVSALEARLAVPYAYEQLQADAAALAEYQRAETSFDAELARLDDLDRHLDQQLLLQLVRANRGQGNYNWFDLRGAAALAPDIAFLSQVFADNTFQSRVQALRDLLYLQDRMRLWQQKQEVFADLLVQRGGLREQRLAQIADADLDRRAQALRQQAEAQRARLQELAEARDYLALAEDAGLRDNLDTVEAAEAAAHLLAGAGQEVGAEQRQLAFYRGRLLWAAQERYRDNLWRQTRALQALDAALAELDSRRAGLAQAVAQAPEIRPYQARLTELRLRTELALAELDSQLAEQELALRAQVKTALAEQRARLKHYLARARLAIARLYDERLKS